MQSLQITLTGKIQNTGFPFYVKQFAELNHIKGTVHISGNISIIIEAEGEESNLDRFIEYCRIGPLGASVFTLNVARSGKRGFDSFQIIENENNKT
jgi:acylphosphatase